MLFYKTSKLWDNYYTIVNPVVIELNITTHPKTINPDQIAFPNLRYNMNNATPIVTKDEDT